MELCGESTWAGEDSNLRRLSRQIYSLLPLAAWVPTREGHDSVTPMPSFDVVSEVDEQEVRNAVDQAQREVATRFDFKDTGSAIELGKDELTLRSNTEDRLAALRVVVEEKFVRRKLSLKILDWGRVEDAAGQTVRQRAGLRAGISAEAARDLNKRIKALGLKGIQSQTQGDAVRVTGKKRDDLQAVIAAVKEADVDLPLQFKNFRD